MIPPSTSAVLAATLFLISVVWVIRHRLFLICFLLFNLASFGWRLASSIYIDVAGPVYAEQLFRDVGGGHSAIVLVSAQLTVLLAFLVVFSRRRIRRLASLPTLGAPVTGKLRSGTLAKAAFVFLIIYVGLLWLDFFRIGVFPIVSGTEELVYSRDFGGFFHGLQIKYGPLLSFQLGLFYFSPLILGRRPNRRFLIVLLFILVYMLASGHRYSAFFTYSTFFVMPAGAVLLRRLMLGNAQPRFAGKRTMGATAQLGIISAIVLTMVGFAVYRSLIFYDVAERDRVAAYLQQRMLVQQGELWWGTYERVVVRKEYHPEQAVRMLFRDVIVPDRNSTLPYLMEREIGVRVYEIVEQGAAYSGGFPEAAFELFGSVLAFLFIFAMASLAALLFCRLAEAVLLGHVIRTFLIFYVLYALLLFQASGFLNFLVAWTFWVKVSVLVLWIMVEAAAASRSLSHPRVAPSPTG